MSTDKKYLTIDEQIEHLKNKGLNVGNIKNAKKYLAEIGYYKLINGYRQPFMFFNDKTNQKEFYSNTSLEELYFLYTFDEELKNLIFNKISSLEVKIKATMSDVISRKYGINNNIYLAEENFKPDSSKGITFKSLKDEVSKNIEKQYNKQKSITWYHDNYGFYPFWVLSNVLPLGTISIIYSKMKQADQNDIAKVFCVKPKFLESALVILQLFRNASAHNEVVYNLKTHKSLSQKDIDYIYKYLEIAKSDTTGRYINGTNDFLALLICFSQLLNKNLYNMTIERLNNMLIKLESRVDKEMYNKILNDMGLKIELKKLKQLKLLNKEH